MEGRHAFPLDGENLRHGLNGVDAPYERPTHADVVLRSGEESVEAAVERVSRALAAGVPCPSLSRR